MSGFDGFSASTIEFLADLAANNSRAWFEANRSRYEAHWKTPSLDLIAALAPGLVAAKPALEAVPKIGGSLRRIHRDTRFSKDKTPYAPQIHLAFEVAGAAGLYRGMHLVLHADHLGFGAGQYGLSADNLTRYRDRIADPEQRRALLAAASTAEAVGSVWDTPELKRLPKGYESEPDWQHLLRRKSVILRGSSADLPDWLFTPDCVPKLQEVIGAHLPLLGWLAG